jgi:transcription initiation factor TFIID subunit 15
MRLSVILTLIASVALSVEAVSIGEDGYYSMQRRQNKFGQGSKQNGQQNKGAASSTAAAATASAAAKANTGKNNGAVNTGQNNNANAALTLNANNIQKGSQADGQAIPAAGQSASLTYA